MLCFFASDLHGIPARYRALFTQIARERPGAVFLGGDLLPGARELIAKAHTDETASPFFTFFDRELTSLKEELGDEYPSIFLIFGNDDPRSEEHHVQSLEQKGLVQYVHGQWIEFRGWTVLGYSFVPPTPFLFKDWERYDVSRYVDPGCISPEEGYRSVPVDDSSIRFGTIAGDLKQLSDTRDPRSSILLFHAPPYNTFLDRAALDDKMVDHVPLDVHVGSIAISRYLEEHQPAASLHGHIHESARLTGEWRCRIGRTHCLGAAHDGPELALVRFDPDDLENATRELISTVAL